MQVKEVLAELAMVESEIARLEIQITQLQKDLKTEQQQTTKSKQWSSEQPQTNNNNPNNKPPLHWNPISKATFDTKALHFISKAIKGDYVLNHFKLDNAKNSELDPRDTNDTHHLLHEVKLHERVSRKSGLLVASSPLRDPRHPSPKVHHISFYLIRSFKFAIIPFILWSFFYRSFFLFVLYIYEIFVLMNQS